MKHERTSTSVVQATVEQVLPSLGLAYLCSDDAKEFAVTQATQGLGPTLAQLEPGQRVSVTVEHYKGYSIISQWGGLS